MTDLRAAAFRSTPYRITVRGIDFRFPVWTAAQWLEVTADGQWPVTVCASMDAESHDRFLDAVEAGTLTVHDITRVARAAEAASAGRSWWEAERLIASLYEDGGNLLGRLIMAGVDPSRITLAALCSALWSELIKGGDATHRMKVESQLVVPPADADDEDLDALPQEDISQTVQRLRNMPGMSIG